MIEDIVLVPKERIGALVGKKGEIKAKIEEQLGIKLNIDSETGEIRILREESTEPLLGIKAIEIIKAIGRGFSPQKAYKLLSENIYIEVIDLSEYASGSSLSRVKSRIIGREGRARAYIEELTGADVSVYGKTVSIIGDEESLALAKEAIMRITEGATHSAVFHYLERKRKEVKNGR